MNFKFFIPIFCSVTISNFVFAGKAEVMEFINQEPAVQEALEHATKGAEIVSREIIVLAKTDHKTKKASTGGNGFSRTYLVKIFYKGLFPDPEQPDTFSDSILIFVSEWDFGRSNIPGNDEFFKGIKIQDISKDIFGKLRRDMLVMEGVGEYTHRH